MLPIRAVAAVPHSTPATSTHAVAAVAPSTPTVAASTMQVILFIISYTLDGASSLLQSFSFSFIQINEYHFFVFI